MTGLSGGRTGPFAMPRPARAKRSVRVSPSLEGWGVARLEKIAPENMREVFEALLVGVEIGKEQVVVTVRPIELRRFLEWDDNSTFRSRPSDWPLSEARFDFRLEIRVVSPEKWPTLHVEAKGLDGP